jgi:hypothetical protein
VLSKTKTKLIANQFSRPKVIDCLGELLTRRWNAWHSDTDIAFSQLTVKGLMAELCMVLMTELCTF